MITVPGFSLAVSPDPSCLTSGADEITIVLSAWNPRFKRQEKKSFSYSAGTISPWLLLNHSTFHPLTRSFIFEGGDILG